MMQHLQLNILTNTPLTHDIYRMWLSSDDTSVVQQIVAGQFVEIAVNGLYLRRPISISDVSENTFSIVYRVVGEGTRRLALLQTGATLDVLLPLGNGYDLSKAGERPLIIGGGVGVPPLMLLAKRLRQQGKSVDVLLGFNTKDDVISQLTYEFRQAGCEVIICTMDGSEGIKGLVTHALSTCLNPRHYSFYYACGPQPMLQALLGIMTIEGQMSLEERMGCGFGVCMGCSVKTRSGNKRVCADGPVFSTNDLRFNPIV